MSDVFVNEGDSTEVDPVESDGQVAEVSPEAPEQYFDVSQYADQKVRVKVDGEELTVPLSELPNGYMRHEDYTRKTQSLAAQQREAEAALTIQRALEANPAETLRVLQAAYNNAEVATSEQDDEDAFMDPVEKALRQEINDLRSQIAPITDQRAMDAVQREVDGLSSTYGELFDTNKESVIRTAIAMQSDLETAFRVVAFDLLHAKQQGASDFNTAAEADAAARLQAKTAAADLVSGGTSANGVPTPSARTHSLREALMESARELNMTL